VSTKTKKEKKEGWFKIKTHTKGKEEYVRRKEQRHGPSNVVLIGKGSSNYYFDVALLYLFIAYHIFSISKPLSTPLHNQAKALTINPIMLASRLSYLPPKRICDSSKYLPTTENIIPCSALAANL